jgi:hypothetical protein
MHCEMTGQRKPELESEPKCTEISAKRLNIGPRIVVVTCRGARK